MITIRRHIWGTYDVLLLSMNSFDDIISHSCEDFWVTEWSEWETGADGLHEIPFSYEGIEFSEDLY